VPAECRHANEGGPNEDTESGGAHTQSPPDLLARQTPINAPPVGCRAQVTYSILTSIEQLAHSVPNCLFGKIQAARSLIQGSTCRFLRQGRQAAR
jgi:hypothetical protein